MPSKRPVERYRSPASGSTTTISFPRVPGRRATWSAAATAAPEEMPRGDPLLLVKAPGRLHRLVVRDGDDLVDEGEVEYVRLEPGADALDLVRPRLRRFALLDGGQHRGVDGLDRDGEDRLLLLLEEAGHAGDRAARADAGDEDVHLAVGVVARSRGRSS